MRTKLSFGMKRDGEKKDCSRFCGDLKRTRRSEKKKKGANLAKNAGEKQWKQIMPKKGVEGVCPSELAEASEEFRDWAHSVCVAARREISFYLYTRTFADLH